MRARTNERCERLSFAEVRRQAAVSAERRSLERIPISLPGLDELACWHRLGLNMLRAAQAEAAAVVPLVPLRASNVSECPSLDLLGHAGRRKAPPTRV